MSDIDTSELRALLAAATPGPWRQECSEMCANVIEADDDEQAVASTWAPSSLPDNDYRREENNAALIAAAVNALPALLDAADERDAAIAAVERVTYLVERWEREAIERGPGDKVNTKGVAAMLRHAIGRTEVTP